MKFMLFIYPDRSIQLTPEQRSEIPAKVAEWVEEMDGRGVRLQGHFRAPPSEATTIRVREGEVERGDGPAMQAETHVSGFNILDCADLDEAIELAAKHPVATFGPLELRAFAD